jgi:endonuclease G
MADIFGDVFDKKRLAPGQITRRANGLVLHDCSTLGGNSGSVVLDLESGSALGLHFAGRFLEANYAVPAEIVARRLEAVTRGESRSSTAVTRAAADRDDGGRRSADAQTAARQLTVTIPVRITVDVGAVADDTRPVVSAVASPTPAQDRELEDDELILTEGRPADYVDRTGYDADFLGDGNEVPLPNVIRDANDVLPFEVDGGTRTVLDYEHFSVVMSRRRKMCIFSAVNIDGTRPHRIKRTAWRTDPRIPADAQTVRGCYGNPPKFARGHMTRREDPIWGNRDDATRGNADSMHLTNAVPQMQPFNAGIWLGLEDYALQNAREDDMRVCVFTGPVFRGDDPRRFGVKIPVTFWKVIAFIHDETSELCATGYTMSQADFLREQEFVFGAHRTAQASLAVIEDLTGLSFGTLTAVDPLAGDVEEATPPPLTSFGQIRFTR